MSLTRTPVRGDYIFTSTGQNGQQSCLYRSTYYPSAQTTRIELPRNRHLDLTPPIDHSLSSRPIVLDAARGFRVAGGYRTDAHMHEPVGSLAKPWFDPLPKSTLSWPISLPLASTSPFGKW